MEADVAAFGEYGKTDDVVLAAIWKVDCGSDEL